MRYKKKMSWRCQITVMLKAKYPSQGFQVTKKNNVSARSLSVL